MRIDDVLKLAAKCDGFCGRCYPRCAVLYACAIRTIATHAPKCTNAQVSVCGMFINTRCTVHIDFSEDRATIAEVVIYLRLVQCLQNWHG
eukprot:SAG31_NODE_774_length_12192_cov_26.736128_6_plen_90_part_00